MQMREIDVVAPVVREQQRNDNGIGACACFLFVPIVCKLCWSVGRLLCPTVNSENPNGQRQNGLRIPKGNTHTRAHRFRKRGYAHI